MNEVLAGGIDHAPRNGYPRLAGGLISVLSVTGVACSPETSEYESASDSNTLEVNWVERQNNGPECVGVYEPIIVDFEQNPIDNVVVQDPIWQVGENIDISDPLATPEQYGYLFIEETTKEADDDIEYILDKSLGLEQWATEDHASEKLKLISNLNTIINAINKFPKGFFKAFDVDAFRIADISDTNGGTYNPYTNEITFEYDDGNSVSNQWLYEFLVHELSHAFHDKFCDGNMWQDTRITELNTVDYIGYAGEMSTEAFDEFISQVPSSATNYGEAREFVSWYGATLVPEDFATIVAWTFSNRGLIQEGDKDFGSVLHKKQMIILERLEEMIPGVNDFLKKQTVALRLDANNEIYSDKETPQLTLSYNDLALKLFNAEAQGKVLSLNGFTTYSDSNSFPNRNVLFNPRLNLDGKIEGINVDVDVRSGVSTGVNVLSYFPGNEMVIFVKNENIESFIINPEELFVATDISPDEITSDSLHTDDDNDLIWITELLNQGYSPIKVTFSV